eukprot:537768-Prorocentrum_minimum.AAC.1
MGPSSQVARFDWSYDGSDALTGPSSQVARFDRSYNGSDALTGLPWRIPIGRRTRGSSSFRTRRSLPRYWTRKSPAGRYSTPQPPIGPDMGRSDSPHVGVPGGGVRLVSKSRGGLEEV